MKNILFFRILFCIMLGLFSIESAHASVHFKNKRGITAVNQSITAPNFKKGRHVGRKQLKILPFGNLVFWTLKWKLQKWLDRNEGGLKRHQVQNSSPGCFKIKRNTGEVILASTYTMDQTTIKYTLCNSPDTAVYSLPAKEVGRIEGSNGYLFYVGDETSFEYNSVLAFLASALAWAAWLGLFSTLGYVLGIALMLASMYFSIASLRLLRRPGLDYSNHGLAYLLSVIALISNIGLGFLMWVLAAYLNV